MRVLLRCVVVTAPQLADQDWVSGAGNILVKDGAVYEEDKWDSSISGINPRTAVGIRSDGTMVWLVNDL